MKTPKVNKSPGQEKFGILKGGIDKKSSGKVSKKKFNNALSIIKTADQAHSFMNENEDKINIKPKKKKGKHSPKENLNSSDNEKKPKGNKVDVLSKLDGKSKSAKKSLKSDKVPFKFAMNGTSEPFGLKLKSKKKSIFNDIENNSSPIKGPEGKGKKKHKIPFNTDLSRVKPDKSQNVSGSKISSSPEVILGLELEKALSPKSKKNKMKLLRQEKLQKLGKTEVNKKKDIVSPPGNSDITGRKKKRGKKKKSPKNTETSESNFSLFTETNASNAVKALLKAAKSPKSEKKDLFGEDKCIYLQCNLLKASEMSKAVLHVTLPHSILPDSPEVCLLVPDLKGKKNEPDEAIDFYKEMLLKKGIDYISEIVPIRKLKTEITTFAQRRAMANRFDAIIVDGKVGRSARIGRRFAGTKKCVSSVKLENEDWKTAFDKALRKIAVFCQGTGTTTTVKCGREGMSVNDIVENIMTIGRHLANDKIVIGSARNISSVYVKTALSDSFPLYVSIATPNQVSVPEGKKRKVEESLEDEITTVMGATVVVHPSGNVTIKKQKRVVGEESAQVPSILDQKKKQTKNLPQTKFKEGVKGFQKTRKDNDSVLDSTESNFDSESDEHDIKIEGSSVSDAESDEDASGIQDNEASEDEESGEGGTSDEEDSDLDEEVDSESDGEAASDSDDLEDKITEAEMEYLKEVRDMQDSLSQKKKQIKKAGNSQFNKQNPAKPHLNQHEPGKPQKDQQDSGKLQTSQHKNGKPKLNQPNSGEPHVSQHKPGKQQLKHNKFDKLQLKKNKLGSVQQSQHKPGNPQWTELKSGSPQFNNQKHSKKQKQDLNRKNKQENKTFIHQKSKDTKKPDDKVASQPTEKLSFKLKGSQLLHNKGKKEEFTFNKKNKFEKAGGESQSHLMGKKPSPGGKKFNKKMNI